MCIRDSCYGYQIAVLDLRNPTRSDGNNLLHLINKYMDIYKACLLYTSPCVPFSGAGWHPYTTALFGRFVEALCRPFPKWAVIVLH